MDTVRADHLSCYGYSRKTSPSIDRIARYGALFENCFTTATWSPPTHSSIFTGKYPSAHRTLGKNVILESWNTTLAEILSNNGYHTVGITNCGLLAPEYGFSKGFNEYYEMYTIHELQKILTFIKNYPNELIRILLNGFDKHTHITNIKAKETILTIKKKQKPFFLFINYFNCHAAYDPPTPFKKKFCKNFDRARLYLIEYIMNKFNKTTEKIRSSKFNIYKLRKIAADEPETRFSFMAKELKINKEEWDIVKSWYDGEIAYLDYHIGDLVNFLIEEGIFDNTLLIITADHGENLGDHGLADHHFSLYDNILRIPLILVHADNIPSKTRVSSIVSSIDIFPTILDIIGVKIPNGVQGLSLCPFENRKIHDFICAERGGSLTDIEVNHLRKAFSPFSHKLKHIDKGAKCIRSDTYKYILSEDGEEELYNIHEDPAEQYNIINKQREKADYLKEKMRHFLDLSYYGPKKIHHGREEIIDRLRSLGYI